MTIFWDTESSRPGDLKESRVKLLANTWLRGETNIWLLSKKDASIYPLVIRGSKGWVTNSSVRITTDNHPVPKVNPVAGV